MKEHGEFTTAVTEDVARGVGVLERRRMPSGLLRCAQSLVWEAHHPQHERQEGEPRGARVGHAMGSKVAVALGVVKRRDRLKLRAGLPQFPELHQRGTSCPVGEDPVDLVTPTLRGGPAAFGNFQRGMGLTPHNPVAGQTEECRDKASWLFQLVAQRGRLLVGRCNLRAAPARERNEWSADRELELELDAVPILRGWQAGNHCKAPTQVTDGLPVGRALRRALSGFKPIADRAPRLTGLVEMMGNQLWGSSDQLGEALLQRGSDGCVEGSSALAKQCAVSRVTNERVLEQVARVQALRRVGESARPRQVDRGPPPTPLDRGLPPRPTAHGEPHGL